GAGLGQGLRAGQTDAAASAGHKSNAAGEFQHVEIHDPSLLFRLNLQSAVSCPQRVAVAIEAMDPARIGQQPDVIACREAKFADRTCGKIADAGNVDMEEG